MGIAFTEQVLYVQHATQKLAAQHQQMIGPPHMLAAILSMRESGGYRLLDGLTSVAQLDSKIQSLISQRPQVQYPKKHKAPLTRHAKDAMEAASETVMQRDMRWHTADIVIGIVRAANSESVAILAEHGLDAESIKQHLETSGPYLDM